jgi:N6-adenosine-specific RNA methylase IME4
LNRHPATGDGGERYAFVGDDGRAAIYAPVPQVKYRTIVADPPWQYRSAATKADARRHYATMETEDICALPVSDFAEQDAHLWLWTTNGFLHQAHHVAEAWGFEVLTAVTWCKRQPGVGHYLRNNTEHVLFCSRGKPQVPENKPLSTWFVWPRTVHSAKPEAFLDLVEQVSPAPYLELFARRNRFGWDTWGNESLEHVEVAT